MTIAEPQTRQRERYSGRAAASLTAGEAAAAHAAGYEPSGTDDWLIGRDPRRMSQDELRAMGHEAMSPLAALRLRCLDCCAGSPDEVRKCVAMACPSWPFRTGKNPWHEVSEAQREAGRRLAARMHQKSADPRQGLSASDETADEVG